MREIFKCDCSTHLVSIGYEQCDWYGDDLTIVIYDVYNPKTGKAYKNPKLVSDVVLFNNASPKELDKFLHFMQKILNKRKVTLRKKKSRAGTRTAPFMKKLDKTIKNLKIKEKEDYKKEEAKIKKRNKNRL